MKLCTYCKHSPPFETLSHAEARAARCGHPDPPEDYDDKGDLAPRRCRDLNPDGDCFLFEAKADG